VIILDPPKFARNGRSAASYKTLTCWLCSCCILAARWSASPAPACPADLFQKILFGVGGRKAGCAVVMP
jgi:hypothetical protein